MHYIRRRRFMALRYSGCKGGKILLDASTRWV